MCKVCTEAVYSVVLSCFSGFVCLVLVAFQVPQLSLNPRAIYPSLCLVVDTACTPSFHFGCLPNILQVSSGTSDTIIYSATTMKDKMTWKEDRYQGYDYRYVEN